MVELILTFGTVVNALGGAFLIAFAVFIATVRPRTTESLAFAVFAGGFGLWTALWNVWGRSDPLFPVAFHTQTVAAVAAAAALVVLVLNFPARLRREEARLLVLPAAVAIAVGTVASAALLVVPGADASFMAFWNYVPSFRDAWIVWWVGITGVFFPAILFTLVLIPLRFPAEVRRASHLVPSFVTISVVLTLYAGFIAGTFYLTADPATLVFSVGTIGAMVLASVLWLRCSAKNVAPRTSRNMALFTLAMPFLGMLLATVRGGLFNAAGTGAFGVIRTAAVVVLGYAVLRHHLFDIDVKVKWSIKQSTLAAIFIVVFFVVSEIAQVLFAQWFGGSLDDVQANIIDILAAGGLLFALAPLQRFAESVADTAMPGVKDVGEMTDDERVAVYRDQAVVAWTDGSLSRDERVMLDGLRETLGLSRDQAGRIESEVAGGEG